LQGLRRLLDWSGRAGARSSGCGHVHGQASGARQKCRRRNDSSAKQAKSGVYVRKTGHPRGEGKIPECLRPEAPKERKNLAQCASAGFPSPRTGSPGTERKIGCTIFRPPPGGFAAHPPSQASRPGLSSAALTGWRGVRAYWLRLDPCEFLRSLHSPPLSYRAP
jgi:hypothetical protein